MVQLLNPGRELAEPKQISRFQVMISEAVREGVKAARNPVEILCGETVSFEELREFLTRKRGQESPVTDPVVSRFIAAHGIPEVATRIYSLGHAVRAAQGKR